MATVDPSKLEAADLPARFGRYELLRILGRGGMGLVFEADLVGPAGFRKRVALKVLLGAMRRAIDDLVHEARLGGLMAHPNVVDTYELGEHDRVVFVAMEMVRGPTLTQLLQKGALPPRAALEVLIQLCAGLAHAHSLEVRGQPAGLVHRDLKPANVLLTPEGLVKIADFGIAVLASEEPAAVAGTPGYMAPEQALGDLVDARTDLFSVGVMGWELVAGSRLLATRKGQQGRVARPLGLERKLADPSFTEPVLRSLPELLPILQRCLRFDPERRFDDASQLTTELRALAPPQGPGLADVLRVRGLGGDSAQSLSLFSSSQATRTGPTGARHNLDEDRDAFFGRLEEQRALLEYLDAGERVLVLKGPGGAGKTRLSQRVALRMADRLAGGAWFCELAEATGEEGVVHAVLQALDVAAGADPVATIGSTLDGRAPLLLVMDNAEQVVDCVARLVGRWAKDAPGARFLVTSRERLRVRGERVVEIGELDHESAVRLFEERARARGWSGAEADRDAVGQIVERLDRMPLAIELAAARARLVPPSVILQRMEDRFRLLRGGQRGGPERQSSLHAAIAGSWDVCTLAEQRTLAQLGVFAGGFTLEAAEAVVDLTGVPDAPWVMDVVESLLDRSLLVGHAGPVPRFRALESIRAFAADRLADLGSEVVREAELRHARWFDALAQPALAADGDDRLDHPVVLAGEVDNLVNAARRMRDRGERDLAMSLAVGAAIALRSRGPFGVIVKLLASIRERFSPMEGWLALRIASCEMEAAYRAGDLAAMEALDQGLEAMVPADPDAACRQCRALIRGVYALARSDWAAAEVFTEEALAAAIEAGLRNAEAKALRNLGTMAARRGAFDRARDLTARALVLHESMGDQSGAVSARLNLGNILKELGDQREAERLYVAVYDDARAIGDRAHAGMAMGNLGVVLAHQGRFEDASRAYNRAIRKHRALGSKRMLGAVRLNLAAALLAQGKAMEALAQADEALPDMEASGARMQAGLAHLSRGKSLLALERRPEARASLERALELGRESGTTVLIGATLAAIAEWELTGGAVAAARAQTDRAIELLEEASEVVVLLQGYCLNAEVLIAEGRGVEALEQLGEVRARMARHAVGEQSEVGIRVRALQTALGT